MNDASKIRSAALSRRSILRKAALAAGGTAFLGTVTGGNRVAEAQTKMAQSAAGYQPTPHQGQACANCLQFVPPDACKVVEGTVSPAGWCKLYIKKPA